MNTRKKLFFACGIGLAAASAQAEITFYGFATLDGGIGNIDDNPGLDLSADPFSDQPTRLFGYDDKLDFENNSLLALQATSDLGDGLSATAQVIARGSDQWNAKLAWAYIGYEINDNVKIIAGRQRMPFYVVSDYLDVSYAYHWITPPEGAYSLPFDSTNGIGAIITHQLGSADSTLHFVTGRIKEDLQLDQPRAADLSNMYSAAWTLNFSDFSLRAGYASANLQYSVPELEPLVANWMGAVAQDFSEQILASDEDNKGSFVGFGATYDNGNWLAIGEYTEITVDGTTLPAKQTSYYFTLGKRFGDVTPHITYGVDENEASSTSFIDPYRGSEPLEDLVNFTDGVFNSKDLIVDYDYTTVGIRWDFHSSAAFKVDYTVHNAHQYERTDHLLRFAISTVF